MVSSSENQKKKKIHQKINRLVKCWIGTKTFPLVDHSIQQEEKVVGPQQHQNKLSWGKGVLIAMWYLWIAIIAGVYPVYPTPPVVVHIPDQAGRKSQIKGEMEAVITEQSVSQAPNNESRKLRPETLNQKCARFILEK
jgi:hypothetical protein